MLELLWAHRSHVVIHLHKLLLIRVWNERIWIHYILPMQSQLTLLVVRLLLGVQLVFDTCTAESPCSSWHLEAAWVLLREDLGRLHYWRRVGIMNITIFQCWRLVGNWHGSLLELVIAWGNLDGAWLLSLHCVTIISFDWLLIVF